MEENQITFAIVHGRYEKLIIDYKLRTALLAEKYGKWAWPAYI